MTAAAGGLAMWLFYLSAAAWGNFIWSGEHIQLYLEEPVSGNEAVAAVQQRLEALEKAVFEDDQEELPEFCIWGQRERALLENKSLSRTIQAQVILFSGNSELLFQGCKMPVSGDLEGCLVDEGVAWELFGSIHVAGKEITYEENTYRIRKVLPGREKIAVFRVGSLSDDPETGNLAQETGGQDQKQRQRFNRVTLRKTTAQSVNDLLLSWSGRYNLYPKLLDLELLQGVSGFCVLLLPVTVCMLFLCRLCQLCRRQQGWKGKTALAAAALLLAALTWLLLKRWIHIPDDYIPAKWSDFSFWSNLLKEKRESAGLLIGMPKSQLDYAWLNSFFKSAGSGICAEVTAGFLILFYSRRRKGCLLGLRLPPIRSHFTTKKRHSMRFSYCRRIGMPINRTVRHNVLCQSKKNDKEVQSNENQRSQRTNDTDGRGRRNSGQ